MVLFSWFGNAAGSLVRSLAGTRTEGRARRKRAGAHAEARTEGRRNITQEFAAAGAAAFGSKSSSGISTKPVTAGLAQRIDTLHREAGQILHFLSPTGRKAQMDRGATDCRRHSKDLRALLGGRDNLRKRPGYAPQNLAGHSTKNSGQANLMAEIVPRAACGVKRKGY